MTVKSVKKLCESLNYQFTNIVLLYEALTHDFDEKDSEWVIPYGNVTYPKQKFHRLKFLGKSVLKCLLAEIAIPVIVKDTKYCSYRTVEGALHNFCIDFLNGSKLDIIGGELNLKAYINVRKGYNGTLEQLYPSVLKAIFGAVFIDSGGCDGHLDKNGLNAARQLLSHLWTFSWQTTEVDSSLLIASIKKNHKTQQKYEDYINVGLTLRKYGCPLTTHRNQLEKIIEYDFKDPQLFEQAMTHESVKQYYDLTDVPNYEALEFLGDAVYELVICEYLYWCFMDKQDEQLQIQLCFYTSADFQKAICNSLEIEDFILKEKFTIISDTHDFLESLIGAIYLDSNMSIETVKSVIIVGCFQKLSEDIYSQRQKRLPLLTHKKYIGSFYRTFNEPKFLSDPLPVPLQRHFKIENIYRFANYGAELSNQQFHIKSFQEAIETEKEDMTNIYKGFPDACNKLEFHRTSLYRTAARLLDKKYRKLIDVNTGEVLNIYHTYSNFEIGEQTIECIPECRSIGEVRVKSNKENRTRIVSNEELFIALRILWVWLLMWILYFLQFGKLVLGGILKVLKTLFYVVILISLVDVAAHIYNKKVNDSING